MPNAPARHKAAPRNSTPTHRPKQADTRPSAWHRGYDARWRKLRLWFLARNPLCADCLARGRTEAAAEVHHVIAISKGGKRLDPGNLMALCKRCHSRRTGSVQ